MRRVERVTGVLAAGAFAVIACRAPRPAELDTRNDACALCRMAVSDARFAAQLAAPGELPRFFDDIGCLATWLGQQQAPGGSIAFVADHRTRVWIRADRAVFTRVPGLETPMGSHLIAHADAASRDQDPSARGGAAVAPSEVFGATGPPVGEAR